MPPPGSGTPAVEPTGWSPSRTAVPPSHTDGTGAGGGGGSSDPDNRVVVGGTHKACSADADADVDPLKGFETRSFRILYPCQHP